MTNKSIGLLVIATLWHHVNVHGQIDFEKATGEHRSRPSPPASISWIDFANPHQSEFPFTVRSRSTYPFLLDSLLYFFFYLKTDKFWREKPKFGHILISKPKCLTIFFLKNQKKKKKRREFWHVFHVVDDCFKIVRCIFMVELDVTFNRLRNVVNACNCFKWDNQCESYMNSYRFPSSIIIIWRLNSRRNGNQPTNWLPQSVINF